MSARSSPATSSTQTCSGSRPIGDDSGQVETLPDGSVSIPVFEERLVVEKRLVVTERVIIRKWSTNEDQEVQAELRRERIEIEVDPEIAGRVSGDISGNGPSSQR